MRVEKHYPEGWFLYLDDTDRKAVYYNTVEELFNAMLLASGGLCNENQD